MSYTVDDLLSEAKVRANYPDSGGSITDSELLQLGNDELQSILSGRLLSVMRDFYATEVVIPIVSGQAAYDIPTRAIGSKINYVKLQDAVGNRFALPALAQATAAGYNRTVSSSTSGYMLQGSQIVLVPATNNTSYSLVVGYFQRPGRMALKASCATLTAAAAAGATSVSVSNASSQITSAGTGYVDLVQANPHFRYTSIDCKLSAANTTTLTLTAGLTDVASVGDWACPQYSSCVVQLPVEAQALLATRWSMRILRQRGDLQQAEGMKADIADLESSLLEYFSNRIESQVDTMGSQLLDGSMGLWGYSGWSF